MPLGEKIKGLRKERGLEQKDLAEACGVTKSAISRFETGARAGPRGDLILKIARKLCVSPDYLLDESMPYPYKPVKWREKLGKGDDTRKVCARITQEELALLTALRKQKRAVLALVYSVPEMPIEVLWMVSQVMKRSL